MCSKATPLLFAAWQCMETKVSVGVGGEVQSPIAAHAGHAQLHRTEAVIPWVAFRGCRTLLASLRWRVHLFCEKHGDFVTRITFAVYLLATYLLHCFYYT